MALIPKGSILEQVEDKKQDSPYKQMLKQRWWQAWTVNKLLQHISAANSNNNTSNTIINQAMLCLYREIAHAH